MKTYNISVKEILEKIVEVEATSESEALDITRKMYKNVEIELDYNNLVEVNFDNLESE